MAVSSDEIVFTRLLRPEVNFPDDYVLAPPAQLGFWLIDNWWRLNWECLPPGGPRADWRLAHELASIGGGYVWPRLAIWGEGERVGLACQVALRSRWSGDRRFELSRALGDVIWTSDALGPLARSKTERQKFQRAFAQSLLCPFEDLISYINTDHPTDEDFSAAAKHFHVSEKVIQTTLVNKRIIHRDPLEDQVEAA